MRPAGVVPCARGEHGPSAECYYGRSSGADDDRSGFLKNVMRGRRNNVNILDQVTMDYKRDDIPAFNVGDTLRVHVKIVEGQRERIQVFEGYVLKRQHGGVNETFTVRKLSNGIGVEKTFPLHSPRIEKIEVVKRGRVRRAKLNYMRQRTGKAARIRSAE